MSDLTRPVPVLPRNVDLIGAKEVSQAILAWHKDDAGALADDTGKLAHAVVLLTKVCDDLIARVQRLERAAAKPPPAAPSPGPP